MDLKDYRQQMDDIDDQMIRLFQQRMETAGKIAEYKKEKGLPVRLAPPTLCYQRAAAVGLAAQNHLREAVSPAALTPCYLRPANALKLSERQKETL